jgi:hypothetical protein
MIEERAGKLEVKVEEALPIGVGAVAFGITDGVVEAFAGELDSLTRSWGLPGWAGIPLFGVEPLAPLDDWLIDVVGPSIVSLVGVASKNKEVTNAGVGGLLYGVPKILHYMMVRARGASQPVGPGVMPQRVQARYVVRG